MFREECFGLAEKLKSPRWVGLESSRDNELTLIWLRKKKSFQIQIVSSLSKNFLLNSFIREIL